MPRVFKTYERAPYTPYHCVVCRNQGGIDNVLIDLDRQIDFHGMVYLCYRCLVAVGDQMGFVTPERAVALKEENAALNEKIKRIPLITERLINDIRDISINASADLLADPAAIVPANDENPEPSNEGASEAERGDDEAARSVSEPAVVEGSDSVPANPSRKRTTRTTPPASPVNNG